MINRVQAFNNKSNYQQNFGMAVLYQDARARKFVEQLPDALVARSKGNEIIRETAGKIKQAIATMTNDRANDAHVDVLIRSVEVGDGAEIVIAKKDGKEAVREGSGTTLYVERSTQCMLDDIQTINRTAAELNVDIESDAISLKGGF